jgi:sterol desaturase/sphingolipid hydroxylase (fatty acid hydroxylase superfamily)
MTGMFKLSPGEILGLFWLNNISRYLLVAGLTYLIFWKWGFNKFKGKFLYSELPSKDDLRREFMYSIMTTVIFLLPTVVAFTLKDFGWNKVYFKIADKGWSWYLVSYVVVFFLHDTYFYWTHRLMHHPKLYKTFHKIHHLSKKPTPLAAFAFHPTEAIVESAIFAIIQFTLPVHFSVLVVFTLFSLFMNVYGHLGFSLFTEKQLNSFPLRIFSHSTHHSWHHQYFKGNYGFYLRFWDRVMGTWKGSLK